MTKYHLTAVILALTTILFAQAPDLMKKQTEALRIENSLKIDGVADELAWQNATIAEGFIQNEPNPGATPSQPTEVKVLYDNTAIYIHALMLDSQPDSILNEMTERDNIGNSDWFGVVLDAYQDGNNGVGFFVTPSGVQFDTKFAVSGRRRGGGPRGLIFSGDRNWDAIWDATSKITDRGWEVEMKIPYSAIRFPNQEYQIWNINFARMIRRSREQLFWNEVNPEIAGYLNQSGQISGISNIKSPVRLSATPFISVYGENYYDKDSNPKSSWGRSFNGGMDIKYGINDAFTLDMTLVPDFGQVRSDNEVLNLSPFEVRFDENRQFFTEGTELFNKAGLFYSRRVGGKLIYRGDAEDNLQAGEEVIENPREAQLINATKISGRANNGLGLGFFNAVSAESHATIENMETGDRREFVTNPLTNYNVFVLDQNLKNNSYVTFTNTNVLRFGDDYDANTTGALFNLKNKAQSYSLQGNAAVSQQYFQDSTELGNSVSLRLNRTSGKWQWSLNYNHETETYDINDLGFLNNNNERSFSANMRYFQFKPFGKFNSGDAGTWIRYSRLYAPNVYNDFGIWLWGRLVTKKFFSFGFNSNFEPFVTYDYFEPRTDDFSRYYRFPRNYRINVWISTDFRKKLALEMEGQVRNWDEDGRIQYQIEFKPRWRVNDQLSFAWEMESTYSFKDVGYVTERDNGDIILGRRDNIEFENLLNATYIFNNRMSFSFRLRHYWAKAEYKSFGLLNEEGILDQTDYNEFSDNSFNAFTIDAVYRWRFAPGSDIFVVWKNNTAYFGSDSQEDVTYSYGESVGNLLDIPQSNSLSLKVIYYLDYLYFNKK